MFHSIINDPVSLIKIVLVQYMFGIKSMRQTIKEIIKREINEDRAKVCIICFKQYQKFG